MRRLLFALALWPASVNATEFYQHQHRGWEISGSNGACVVAKGKFAVTFDLDDNNAASVVFQSANTGPPINHAILSFRGKGKHYFGNKKHFNWHRPGESEGHAVTVSIDYHFFDIIGNRGKATTMYIIAEGRIPMKVDLAGLADAARFTKDCRKQYMGG